MGASSTQPSWFSGSQVDRHADSHASAPVSYFGNTERAPHWLMPDFGGPPTGLSMPTSTTSTDGASIAGSEVTVSARGPWGDPMAWGPETASVANSEMTTSTGGPAWQDGASVGSSAMTVSTRGPQVQPQGQPVSFNAWGPNGEFTRRVKNPTVVSGSTRTEPTFRPTPNLGRKGWYKGVSDLV